MIELWGDVAQLEACGHVLETKVEELKAKAAQAGATPNSRGQKTWQSL